MYGPEEGRHNPMPWANYVKEPRMMSLCHWAYFLSSLRSVSGGGTAALQNRPGTTYYERDCRAAGGVGDGGIGTGGDGTGGTGTGSGGTGTGVGVGPVTTRPPFPPTTFRPRPGGGRRPHPCLEPYFLCGSIIVWTNPCVNRPCVDPSLCGGFLFLNNRWVRVICRTA